MATLDLSLILVAHRSSTVLPAAVAAFRREAAANGLAAEVVVVEHSEDSGEAERVACCRPEALLVRPNRGYAAGVNAGLAAARGHLLLVGNPDVELCAGALAGLLGALASGCDVVGPQFMLAGSLFPPAEVQTPASEAQRRRSTRTVAGWERYARRELRRCLAVWTATAPCPVPTLSGALLAFPAALASRVGEWDEGYFLYFEETDWLSRAVRWGARLAVVPQARAIHRWGHSARPQQAGERFATSQRRFFRRHFPWRGRLALRARGGPHPRARPWREAPTASEWRWLLSPSPRGFPAALATGWPAPSARELCRDSGRDGLTLLGFRDERKPFPLSGPYAWSAAADGAPETGSGPGDCWR